VRTALERALDRDRLIVIVGLTAATLLAWGWIAPMSRDMYGSMTGSSAWMMTPVWDPTHLALLFAMWAVMMTAMMLPSAAPAILLYAAVVRRSVEAAAAGRAYLFAAGYLIVWSLFAAAAVALQRLLTEQLILTPMMELSSRRASSLVLALAGLYQLTPFKRSCLSACRSPADFIAKYWRNGAWGALVMGLRHGRYCLGCCWALMTLLFAGGVMHLPTIAGITVLVLIEKLLPVGRHEKVFTWITGGLLLLLAALALR
jgi:predicted metal-binding membrane protein